MELVGFFRHPHYMALCLQSSTMNEKRMNFFASFNYVWLRVRNNDIPVQFLGQSHKAYKRPLRCSQRDLKIDREIISFQWLWIESKECERGRRNRGKIFTPLLEQSTATLNRNLDREYRHYFIDVNNVRNDPDLRQKRLPVPWRWSTRTSTGQNDGW